MRILLASDLHYRLPQFDWLVEQVPTVDVVALPGDHLDVASAVPVPAQIVVISKYLERLGEQALVLASSGNHDLDGPGSNDEQVAGWLQRARSERVRVAAGRPARWVWLYHSPPEGTGLCWTGRRAYPDPDLTAWIGRYQPDLVVCGHIHQAPWAEGGAWAAQLGRTWVFNPGHQPGAVPAHVLIDLEAGAAEWVGLPERDEVALG